MFDEDPSCGESSSVQVTKEELVLSLRRQSKGFSRGTSRYRGVTRHQKVRPNPNPNPNPNPSPSPCRPPLTSTQRWARNMAVKGGVHHAAKSRSVGVDIDRHH